ncbi:MAG: hypothetical protein QOD07_2468 [Frankiaceae bacterium]|jgi:hypothetical protein|nr:hypothetical protein [Frankiaceae bacterium]
MRIRTFLRSAVCAASGIVLLASGSAHALNAEHVEWTADGWSNCTTGTSSGWSCDYDLYSTNCPEAAVVGTPLASCYVYVHAEVPVVPVVNAAGRLVGCTSGPNAVALTASYVYYDSTFNEFDNSRIDAIFVGQVHDVFADGKPGALTFTAYDANQSNDPTGATWLVHGDFTGSCKRGAYYVSGTGAGTVDVQV